MTAFVLMASVASAGTIQVTTNQDSDASGTGDCLGQDSNDCTLRDAINAAQNSDTVSLPAGDYQLTQPGKLLSISANITLKGTGARTTTIDQTMSNTGVLYVVGATATVQGVTITGGQVTGAGAGINSSGSLTLEDTAVTGNEADGHTTCTDPPECTIQTASPGAGGGISSSGTLTIIDSTVSDNIAGAGGGAANPEGGAWGGGIFSTDSALRIVNSTIAGNSAEGSLGSALGGGIYMLGGSASRLGLANATIVSNTVSGGPNQTQGGNVYLSQGSGTVISDVKDSIIAAGTGTSGSENCAGGTLTSAGHNLENLNQCGFTSASDQNSTGAKLGQLDNHGGPTDTVALLAGSPAINAGNPTGCKDPSNVAIIADQRGIARPQGTSCDIGAFEFQTPSLRGVPAVFGKPVPGQRLKCVFTVQSPDGPVGTTVKWLRNKSTVVGTRLTYVVKSSDAGHSLSCEVVATNSAGSASGTSRAVLARTGPTVSITFHHLSGTTATFRFQPKDATRTFCALARGHNVPSYSACTSPKTYRHLAKGSYTFFVRAVGLDGSSRPAKLSFKIG